MLHVDDAVFQDLEVELRNKRLSNKFGGVVDMVSLAIFESMRANQTERTLRYRKKERVVNAVGK